MTPEFNYFKHFSHCTRQNLTLLCRGQDPPRYSRQMFSVNNYYVVTYVTSKKQAQRRELTGSPQHSSVSTFNTYAGKKGPQSNEFICSCALYTCNISYFQKKHSHVYTSCTEISDFLEGNVLTLSIRTEYIYSVASQATSPAPFKYLFNKYPY
jgi:hypothetical protein